MTPAATHPNLFDSDARAGPLHDVPNPKPSAADKNGFGRVASLYTAFSSEFATFAVEFCLSLGHRRIGDPFAGMGTLGEAGRPFPVQLNLNDLNPFAISSCCLRASTSAQIEEAIDAVRLQALQGRGESEDLRFKLAVDALLPPDTTVQECFASPNTDSARHAIRCLHILSAARIAMHKRLRGSNPTWTKRADAKIASGIDFEEALAGVSYHFSDYAAQVQSMSAEFSVDLANQNVANLDWEAGSLDAIVTSPPYPNRTDYIRHYLPAAELLLGGDHDTERTLREVQIGTPLIREAHANTPLPATVETIIERVRTHRSYASERYYAKGFRYYFDDMARSLAQCTRWLSPNGTVILVVQDTYYKEILISVADLLGDIATASGLAVIGKERFKVRHPLSRLSPHSRAVPKPQLFETVLMLTKA
jgi:hypothetical protein